ncbi:hypothetical protein DRE_04641 [Drechslerella stenobrocha 248]|uniref:Uncharacterized protein n=1 Tax=Drechslerella stenobrocha 248 TaxID=1043628 RepID=W7I0Q7_9PEZI|nr:hypothetical protein DRE_04641 [Drechslerella stenobrocha 248]
MELRVLIPVACVIGVLLIIVLVTSVWAIIRAQKRRRKAAAPQWRHDGTAEDNYSIAWSEHGITRGVSVREGKLVRSQSRRTPKDGSKSTVESIEGDSVNLSGKREGGASDFITSISNITGRISPGIGRALSVGSHRTPVMNSEKGRQLSPLPPMDEGSNRYLLDSKRPYSADRKQSSHSHSSSHSNIHDSRAAELEDMTLQGRESVLLPAPPVHSLTPTYSRHSRQSHSNSSFTFTPVTPRASISLFPLTAPPTQQRNPPTSATEPQAFLGNAHSPLPSPSFSFEGGPVTLADYADELRPRSAVRPKVAQIHIPNSSPGSPRAPLSAAHATTGNRRSGHFPTPFNELPRPPHTKAPSSAVGNQKTGSSSSHKDSFGARKDSMRKDSFGAPLPTHRESHGPSTLRRDSTASFLGSTTPKFATGPRVYYQSQTQPSSPQHQPPESITRTYSDRSLHSNYLPSASERQLEVMNMIPSINESKSSIVSLSSTGSAGSDGFAADGGLSPPPMQKTSFESTRADATRSTDHSPSLPANRSMQPAKPPATPPRHAQGQSFAGIDSYALYESNALHRRLANGGVVPETVAEANENLPASPTTTTATAAGTEYSGESMSPRRSSSVR